MAFSINPLCRCSLYCTLSASNGVRFWVSFLSSDSFMTFFEVWVAPYRGEYLPQATPFFYIPPFYPSAVCTPPPFSKWNPRERTFSPRSGFFFFFFSVWLFSFVGPSLILNEGVRPAHGSDRIFLRPSKLTSPGVSRVFFFPPPPSRGGVFFFFFCGTTSPRLSTVFCFCPPSDILIFRFPPPPPVLPSFFFCVFFFFFLVHLVLSVVFSMDSVLLRHQVLACPLGPPPQSS